MADSSDWISSLPPLLLLAATILGEARSEPIDGQIAVASVIRTRTTKRKQTYRQVILAPWQFSCWNENDPNRGYMIGLLSAASSGSPAWLQAQWIATGIIAEMLADNVRGAEHYMTRKVYDISRPKWASGMSIVAEVGRHVFLK